MSRKKLPQGEGKIKISISLDREINIELELLTNNKSKFIENLIINKINNKN